MRSRFAIVSLVVLSVILASHLGDVRLGALFDAHGSENALALLKGLTSPDVSPDFLTRIARLSLESLLIGVLGTTLAAALGFILSILGTRPVFSGAHDATVKLVESGKVQAGALNIEVWERMVRERKVDTNKVKVIWTTPGYVDYVWTARKELSEELRQRFTQAFLDLDPSNLEHRSVLELQGAQKFVPARASDFDALEEVARSVGLLKG